MSWPFEPTYLSASASEWVGRLTCAIRGSLLFSDFFSPDSFGKIHQVFVFRVLWVLGRISSRQGGAWSEG